MAFGITSKGVLKGLMYTAIGLTILGIIKNSMADTWAKIPGLKEF